MRSDDEQSYTLGQAFARQTGTTLHHAIRRSDGLSVVLKVSASEQPSPLDVGRLRHELRITGRLKGSKCVVHAYELHNHGTRPALILEAFGGQRLDQLGMVQSLPQALTLMCRITEAVCDVHARGIVHKDINPHTILVDKTDMSVKLTDFASAAYLRAGDQVVGNLSAIEGTLPYVSPEQTGRMNRPIDYRSDLYSLGMTFYEVLAGTLPFTASDPLEWIQCHIAKTPAAPSKHRLDLPPILDAIILKLLAKVAEERYQTAAGLLHDLNKCRDATGNNATPQPFDLASRDASEKFCIPHKLYGRQPQVHKLIETFEHLLATGLPEVLTVSGVSGLGKSVLVYELYKPLLRERGIFISGKFDQYQRHLPYSGICAALRDLVAQLLTKSPVDLQHIVTDLRESLGNNIGVISSIVPELNLILGVHEPVPKMGPAETRNRLNLAFRRFIQVFARPGQPLVAFLDDMQWADNATLELLETTLASSDVHYFMPILAYRDNEVPRSHPFAEVLARLKHAHINVTAVTLGTLQENHVGQLISDTLRCNPLAVAPLTEIIVNKTGGNPFFVVEFLKTLHHLKLFQYDGKRLSWVWDTAQIRATNVTDNVVTLLIDRLRDLQASTQRVLSLAACIGNTFELDCLSSVFGQSMEDTTEALQEGLDYGLVIQTSSLKHNSDNATYKFHHDRIQQAAYALIGQANQQQVHLQIGQCLLRSLQPERLAAKLFDIVNHLNEARTRIIAPEERLALVNLNKQAGMRAKASTAFEAARVYLRIACDLLPDDAWQTSHPSTFQLYKELAECSYLARHIDEASVLFEELNQRAGCPVERAGIYHLQIRLLQSASRYNDAAQLCCEAFNIFDIDLPDLPEAAPQAITDERRAIAVARGEKTVDDILQMPEMTDASALLQMDLLSVACAPLYVAKPHMFPLATLRMARLSLEHGNCPSSSYAYSCYGLLLAAIFDEVPLGYAMAQMAVQLNEKLGDSHLRGAVIHVFGNHVSFWQAPMNKPVALLEQGFLAAQNVGDFEYANFIGLILSWLFFEKGDSLASVEESMQRYLDFARQSHVEHIYQVLCMQQQVLRVLRGTTQAVRTLDDETFKQAAALAVVRHANFNMGLAFSSVMGLTVAYLEGDYERAEEYAQVGIQNAPYMLSTPANESHGFYHALTLAAVYESAPEPRKPQILAQIGAYSAKLDKSALHCPANMGHKAMLVRAELERLQGDLATALPHYQQAAQSAQSHGFGQHAALAYERLSAVFQSLGMQDLAVQYARQAHGFYQRWGSQKKMQQLATQYPNLACTQQANDGSVVALLGEDRLDMLSVLKASQIISGEMEQSRLVDILMRIIIEHASAQFGALILVHSDGLRLQAAAHAQQGALQVSQELLANASNLVPCSLIEHVAATQERVVLADATVEHEFSNDPCLKHKPARSLVCLPIIRASHLTGVIYLENRLLAGALNAERLRVLDLLAIQVAISIDNAQLYKTSQDAIRARDEFLCVASHELKTPLTPLKIQIQSLTRSLRTDGSTSWTAQRIMRMTNMANIQIERLTHLIDDLLDVASINAGKLKLRRTPMDLVALLRDVVEHFTPQLATVGCTVSLATPEILPGVWDQDRLAQVIGNLLANAQKYAAGKQITISLQCLPDATTLLKVRDEGPGIAGHLHQTIFERFERGGASVNSGGLGLGLYISRQIILNHGGTMAVDSSPGQGATFLVALPNAQAEGIHTAHLPVDDASTPRAKPPRVGLL